MPHSTVAPKGARLALVVLALSLAAGALMWVEVHQHRGDGAALRAPAAGGARGASRPSKP